MGDGRKVPLVPVHLPRTKGEAFCLSPLVPVHLPGTTLLACVAPASTSAFWPPVKIVVGLVQLVKFVFLIWRDGAWGQQEGAFSPGSFTWD
jgi:hypothetical protein